PSKRPRTGSWSRRGGRRRARHSRPPRRPRSTCSPAPDPPFFRDETTFRLLYRGKCSTFVLMVAVVPPLLSDAQPSLAERAGFGDRFHYWRGRSGRRYLFTAVSAATVEDFRF